MEGGWRESAAECLMFARDVICSYNRDGSTSCYNLSHGMLCSDFNLRATGIWIVTRLTGWQYIASLLTSETTGSIRKIQTALDSHGKFVKGNVLQSSQVHL